MGNFRFDIPEAAMKSENKSNFLVYNFCIKKACLTIQKLDRLLVVLGWKIGLEPTTFGTTIRRSNQLSYNHHFAFALQR